MSNESRYLNTAETISELIDRLTDYSLLWLDTEVADWHTENPRLSLIQVLINGDDITRESSYVLDVLDRPAITTEFIDRIMANPQIEKVFHNANFDRKYLGKDKAKNVTCTYKIARRITKQALGASNLKLKTLAVELCDFNRSEIEQEQQSDWGRRPLSKSQFKYAQMDVVYLAAIHQYLLKFQ